MRRESLMKTSSLVCYPLDDDGGRSVLLRLRPVTATTYLYFAAGCACAATMSYLFRRDVVSLQQSAEIRSRLPL